MINKNLLAGKIVSCGYSQRDMARALNVSENTFSAKMNGKSTFNTDQILRLCEILSITDSSEKVQIFLFDSSQNRDDKTA